MVKKVYKLENFSFEVWDTYKCEHFFIFYGKNKKGRAIYQDSRDKEIDANHIGVFKRYRRTGIICKRRIYISYKKYEKMLRPRLGYYVEDV